MISIHSLLNFKILICYRWILQSGSVIHSILFVPFNNRFHKIFKIDLKSRYWRVSNEILLMFCQKTDLTMSKSQWTKIWLIRLVERNKNSGVISIFFSKYNIWHFMSFGYNIGKNSEYNTFYALLFQFQINKSETKDNIVCFL